MAGRLENLRIVDPVLTQIALGYLNADLVSEALFPIVGIDFEAGTVPQFGKESFKIYGTKRAIRGGTNLMTPEGITTVPFVADEHDLGYPIDYREKSESRFNLQQIGTKTVTEAMAVGREKTAADAAQNTSNYPSSNKAGLTGTDCWSNTASHPITQIKVAKEAIRAAIGREPNVLLLGAVSYNLLAEHGDILDRIKYSQLGVLTPQLLQTILDIKKVVVGKSVYSTDAGVMTDLWSDNAILAYVPDMATGDRDIWQPSFAYTYRVKGYPQVDTYFTEGGKVEIVRNTDRYTVQIVGNTAGYLISNTQA